MNSQEEWQKREAKLNVEAKEREPSMRKEIIGFFAEMGITIDEVEFDPRAIGTSKNGVSLDYETDVRFKVKGQWYKFGTSEWGSFKKD